MRRLAAVLISAATLGAAGLTAATSADASSGFLSVLRHDAALAGRSSGIYVLDSGTGRWLFSARAGTARVLASNTKLFTSAAVLGRYGPSSTIATAVLGTGSLGTDGTYQGDLFLRGGGDPTFGSRSFARSAYGGSASVESLADQLRSAGVRRVAGRIVGDESLFDSLRGGPDAGFHTSVYVGPLSALDYDRGLANAQGSAFQRNPPLFAATRLRSALGADHIQVSGGPTTGRTPANALELVEVRSPTISRVLQIMDKTSDNYFAEMLVKGLPVVAAQGGSLRRAGVPMPPLPSPGAPAGTPVPPPPAGVGTTEGGARVAMSYARTLGAAPRLVDGSGLSHSDRASPRDVARLLARLEPRPGFATFFAAL